MVYGEQTAYVRVHLINALNQQLIRTSSLIMAGRSGDPHRCVTNTTGNINGAPQTLRLTVGYKF